MNGLTRACLPTCLPAYLPTCLPACLREYVVDLSSHRLHKKNEFAQMR